MAKSENSLSRTAVWILLALLILGLAGFGATNLSGNLRTIGSVGNKYIDVNQYARQLQQELRAFEAQSGQRVTFEQARQLGLDQTVLARLVRARALDHEAAEMGLSIGDARLRDQIVDIPSFQGIDGNFDRDGYRFALEQAGLTESAFEEQVREESARTILQSAVTAGVIMPDTYAQTMVNYLGETRDFTWARLDFTNLAEALPEPDEATLRAFHSDNIANYQLPETKRITYALLLPDMMLSEVTLSDEELRAAYDEQSDRYNQPERRLVERLVFSSEDEASAAAAQLDVNGTTFEALVESRGLALADVDLGDLPIGALGDAGEGVFAASVGDVVGPFPTALGPALFRVNGILPAQSISFEDAQHELRNALAVGRARRLVEAQAQKYDDLLAGGATLEDLTAETDMTLGQIDWYANYGDGVAAYERFQDLAIQITTDDFPQIESLDDGGLIALRLDEVLPPRDSSYQEVAEQVRTDWEARETEKRLGEQANALLPRLEAGEEFAALELEATVETGRDRQSFLVGAPEDLMTRIFEMEVGEVGRFDGFGAILIARLDKITDASENPEAEDALAQITEQLSQSLARDVLNLYSADTTLRAGPNIDMRAVEAVNANFQ